jgi:conjugative transfer signal peptidase TraF
VRFTRYAPGLLLKGCRTGEPYRLDGLIWPKDGCASIAWAAMAAAKTFFPWACHPARKRAGTPVRPFLASQESLTAAMPPNSLATFLAERGYVPLGVPLIKRILALCGQSVCRNELVISVDGIGMGKALAHDRQGRPLPVWQGCQVMAEGEVFLMNWDEPASFDGRYFGPIPLRAIIGLATPLWTLDKP